MEHVETDSPLVVVQEVVGSIPISHPILSLWLACIAAPAAGTRESMGIALPWRHDSL